MTLANRMIEPFIDRAGISAAVRDLASHIFKARAGSLAPACDLLVKGQ